MKINELNRQQLQQLKTQYYDEILQETEGRGISYGEMFEIDNIITDEKIKNEYAGYIFTKEDFFTESEENWKMTRKVNYKKRFSRNGTAYNQTIKIDFDLAFAFNKYIDEIKEEVMTHFYYTNEDLKILDYLEKINFYNPTFSTLTTLNYFKKFYLSNIYKAPKKDQFLERILQRNTVFEVVKN